MDAWIPFKEGDITSNIFELETHKLLIYINGNCGSCISKIKDWDLLLKKEPWCSNVKPVFVINSNDNFHFFKFIIEKDSTLLKYIYLLDNNKEFYIRNKMENKCFEVVLLNENNIIKLFGSPLINKSIYQTYIKYINDL
jgi:hypothetical protein